jgi:hypothetical protein
MPIKNVHLRLEYLPKSSPLEAIVSAVTHNLKVVEKR